MTRRGVVVSINSDERKKPLTSTRKPRRPSSTATLARRSPQTRHINPAIQLGIDKRVGSIEVGKDADLVIYNHDPLSAYAVVQKTLIDGRVYFDRQQDIAVAPRLRKKRKHSSKRKRRRQETGREKDEKKPATRNRKRRKSPKTCPGCHKPKFRRCKVNRLKFSARCLMLSASAAIFFATPAVAQSPAPATYAITHARLVTLAGSTIEDAHWSSRTARSRYRCRRRSSCWCASHRRQGLAKFRPVSSTRHANGSQRNRCRSSTVDSAETGSFNPDVVAATLSFPPANTFPSRARRHHGSSQLPGSGGFDSFGNRGTVAGQASAFIWLAGPWKTCRSKEARRW